MSNRSQKLLGTVVLGALALSGAMGACDAPSYPPYDRAALLRETTEMVILPGYADAASAASTLHTRTTALCMPVATGGTPSMADLTAARTAWREALLAWQHTSAYQMGPARDMNLGPEIASFPPITATIETNVTGTTAIDAHFVDAQGSGAKGFYAVEYLLFAYPSYTTANDAMTLAALGDARRCQYLDALADHLARITTRVSDAWSPTGGNFAATFAEAGSSGNTAYTTQQSAIEALVTQMRDAVEHVKNERLGMPLGLRTTTGPVESPYAGASIASAEAVIEGAHDAWTVAPHSLDAFLRSRNVSLADRVLAQFMAGSDGLAALESPPLATPFETYVSGTDHAAGQAAYMQLTLLEQMFSGEIAATLGLSIVSSADGD
jgi:predicted lipoprotein